MMRRIMSLLLAILLCISFSACGEDKKTDPGLNIIESTPTENGNNNATTSDNSATTTQPTTNPPAPVDNDAIIKAALIEKNGFPIKLRRTQGMALWMFTLTENSAERTYLHSLEGEIYHKSLSWEIKDGELIISGDWNESFVLDLNANIAISKTDGTQYNIVHKDNSLTMYGTLQDMVLSYGFPIEFRLDKGTEQTILRLFEGYAERERKAHTQTITNDNIAWSIDGNHLCIFGNYEDSLVIDIEAGTAISEKDGAIYHIVRSN